MFENSDSLRPNKQRQRHYTPVTSISSWLLSKKTWRIPSATLEAVPLATDTVKRCTCDISSDTEELLIDTSRERKKSISKQLGPPWAGNHYTVLVLNLQHPQVLLLKKAHVHVHLKFVNEHMNDSDETWENVKGLDETKTELPKLLMSGSWRSTS